MKPNTARLEGSEVDGRWRGRHRGLTGPVACLALALTCAAPAPAQAAGRTVVDALLSDLAATGGADTSNPGTSCFLVSTPVSAACTAGYLAIPNNNSRLLAVALMAKASGTRVRVYYEDASTTTQHCPGMVVTPCAVISISLP